MPLPLSSFAQGSVAGTARAFVRAFVTCGLLLGCALSSQAHAGRPQPRTPDATQRAAQTSSADEAFLGARDAVRAGDHERAAIFSQRVTALDPRYPLASYLEYWALSKQVREYGDALTAAAPDDAVRGFIARNPGSVVADLARRDWLLALGKRGEWGTFKAEMPRFVLNDDAQITCFHLAARALDQIRGASTVTRAASNGGGGGDPAVAVATPDGEAATASSTVATSRAASTSELLRASRVALAQPRNYASDAGACPTLGRILVAEKRISPQEIWSWIRLASDANNLTAARRYAQLLSDAERGGERAPDSTRFYKELDAVLDKPALWIARFGDEDGLGARWKRELVVLALARMARSDPAQAGPTLQRRLAESLSGSERAYLHAQLAAAAAKKQMSDANDWSRKSLAAEGLSEDILTWQVRGALRAEDWKLVEALIEKMPAEMRRAQTSEGTWAYWLARAYKARKKNEAAQALFTQVSDQFGFYGQLATEELGRKITLPARGAPVTEAEVAAVKALPGFVRALYFYRLDMRREGNLEWNFALRDMSDRELLASAEWASRNALLDRAVNTADRTKNEHDFAFRFLTPFKAQMQEKAAANGLELEWVYGLIRQESRFVNVARSSAGASGLMQLMPSTARYVAKKIGMDDYRPDGVVDIDTNLALGTGYLRMVLEDLDNLPVLATAAYNAGPGRPRAWRSTLTRPIEGAIFAETIPFNETRDYVKKVMSNATYYAVLLTGAPQSLKTRMGFVAQRGYTASDLP